MFLFSESILLWEVCHKMVVAPEQHSVAPEQHSVGVPLLIYTYHKMNVWHIFTYTYHKMTPSM